MHQKDDGKPNSKPPRNSRKKQPFVFQEEPEWLETTRLFKEFIADINLSTTMCYNQARHQLVRDSEG